MSKGFSRRPSVLVVLHGCSEPGWEKVTKALAALRPYWGPFGEPAKISA